MPALRAVVLRELGVAEGFAQDPAAASHLQRALDLTPDVRERAAITLELARVAVPGGGSRRPWACSSGRSPPSAPTTASWSCSSKPRCSAPRCSTRRCSSGAASAWRP